MHYQSFNSLYCHKFNLCTYIATMSDSSSVEDLNDFAMRLEVDHGMQLSVYRTVH